MVHLYIYPKTEAPFIFALEGESVSIGRSPDNDLTIPDQFCSGRHALIVGTRDGYAVRDQGSKNGVFINGIKILSETLLRKGDEILLGSTRIVFDEQAPTRVEMVEGPAGPANYNTMIQVRDILKRPPPDTRAAPAQTPAADLERLRREQKILFVLNEVSQALIYHFPLDKLLDHIMDLIIQNIPMDRGVLMLKEGEPFQLVPKVARIVDPGLRNQNIQVSRTILNTALAKNSSILLSDIQSDSFFKEQASVVRSNVRSAMCVPMWNNEEIVGIVYADRASIVNAFTEDDLKLLTLLANVAAVKIENARLFEQSLEKCRMEREMAVAAQIQKNFLPREEPRVEGYEICGGNRGCYQIGGDYYDFIPFENGRLGVAIADVSGCGVGPSLLMASLRASLHAELGDPVERDGTGGAAQRLRPQELGEPHVHHLLLRHPGRGGGRADLRQRGPQSSDPSRDGRRRATAGEHGLLPRHVLRRRLRRRAASAWLRATCSASSPTGSPRAGTPTGRSSGKSASSRSWGGAPAPTRRRSWRRSSTRSGFSPAVPNRPTT